MVHVQTTHVKHRECSTRIALLDREECKAVFNLSKSKVLLTFLFSVGIFMATGLLPVTYINSFFTGIFWICLPLSEFPPSYDLNTLSRGRSRHLSKSFRSCSYNPLSVVLKATIGGLFFLFHLLSALELPPGTQNKNPPIQQACSCCALYNEMNHFTQYQQKYIVSVAHIMR